VGQKRIGDYAKSNQVAILYHLGLMDTAHRALYPAFQSRGK
jgi:hypothetical protein